MALKKRGKTWHTDFVVNGQRFRQSLSTKDWREAQAKEKELIGQASEGKLHQTSTTLARQPFGQAAEDYVAARKLELAQASQAKERQLLVQLRAYFNQEPLKAITAKRIVEYRAWRAEQNVGPATLNAELGILRRILKRAKLWARIADDVRPLKEPSTIGRALSEEDKQRLLKTAVMRPEWETAYLATILCLNTTARSCELKGLQWSDVDLFGRTLTIRKTKTAAGERTIPLTSVAASALARLRTRAESFGITSLAESGASDSTIMAIAGHVSRRMLERYSHVRMEAKRVEMEALANSSRMAGYDTNHDTSTQPASDRPV